ncbi:MAG: hypothetical protein KatS3mg002_1463 [Candidatus Woesearchaeota archaeon]|nr:MAG: hypothetical protein KatS3mg002_1463 [Candidatus Woesearchaeota archaeon]
MKALILNKIILELQKKELLEKTLEIQQKILDHSKTISKYRSMLRKETYRDYSSENENKMHIMGFFIPSKMNHSGYSNSYYKIEISKLQKEIRELQKEEEKVKQKILEINKKIKNVEKQIYKHIFRLVRSYIECYYGHLWENKKILYAFSKMITKIIFYKFIYENYYLKHDYRDDINNELFLYKKIMVLSTFLLKKYLNFLY